MNSAQLWSQVLQLIQHATYPTEEQPVYLFGGGLGGSLVIPLLKEQFHIVAVCDNNEKKQGTLLDGVPCVSPKVLSQTERPFVFVASNKHYQSIHAELQSRNLPHCLVDAYVIHQNLDKFEAVYQSLDEESRRVYAGILCCRLTGNHAEVAQYCSENQYFCFPQFRYLSPEDTIVDCGAFTGDTVEKLVENSCGLFRRIYAFEPNDRAYAAMKKRVSYLKEIWALSDDRILCEQMGVGRENTLASFRENAANLANTSLSTDGGHPQNEVGIVALDDYLTQQKAGHITFLKADIEGFEWDMLHGAEQTIRRDKPRLAISIYHNIFDFYRIYHYLKELVPEYQFAVRHHWNSFDETVLYCYIK